MTSAQEGGQKLADHMNQHAWFEFSMNKIERFVHLEYEFADAMGSPGKKLVVQGPTPLSVLAGLVNRL